MKLAPEDYLEIRRSIAAIPSDVSNDAIGAHAPRIEDIYAPETHAAALDPATPIVVGARGTGKSFWSGVLGQLLTRDAAAKAYPRLGLDRTDVQFGYTGISAPGGLGADAINATVPAGASSEFAKAFWWATILRAAAPAKERTAASLRKAVETALDWESREQILEELESELSSVGKTLIVVYDALDTVATSWSRRRLLTEALLEVVWAMRAYRFIKVKLFLRPDQIDDDALRFVELPKLRAGSVRLAWSSTDLYGLLYSRLALAPDDVAQKAFQKMLSRLKIADAGREAILQRRWVLAYSAESQSSVMQALAGPFMATGRYGYKKGKTYEWPVKHLADSFEEVTPRSFLGLMISAAKYGPPPQDRVITAEGIRHGLRAASKTRVDELHNEFPWIKGVLAPLAGLLLPKEERAVVAAWKRTRTIQSVKSDAQLNNYLPPFPNGSDADERDLFEALKRIGVMFRRKDDRLDMPDLFRIAARLLKKGGTAPV